MAENLQIRLADPKEADRLAEIEAICFPPAEAASHEDVVNRMGAFPENFVVAVKDDQIVGFINGGTTDKPVLPNTVIRGLQENLWNTSRILRKNVEKKL